MLVKHICEIGLDKKCIDEILWSIFFEKYESASRFQKMNWFTRKEFQRYKAAKAQLLRLNNELSKIFSESLERWKTAMIRQNDIA